MDCENLGMVQMQIEIISVIRRDEIVRAFAKARSEKAEICLRVEFPAPMENRKASDWQLARDVVLDHLDPA